MRCVVVLIILSSWVAVATASTYNDPFHQSQSNCSYSLNPPYDGGCDVIGNEMFYDIQMATFSITGNTATVSVYLNTGAVQGAGNSMYINSFSDAGDTLMLGDIFFYNPDTVYDPSNSATTAYLKFGVPLADHDGLTAGNLYQVGSSENAQTALGNPSGQFYRQNETVLITAGTLASTGNGVSIANFGNGITNALYELTVSFPTTANFLALMQNGQIGLLFSSADCANDVLQGDVSTPEPKSLVLFLGGLALVCVVGWKRRQARAQA